jgi:hypothetical protein
MIVRDSISNLQHKSFVNASEPIQKIIDEVEFTSQVQSLLEFGNYHILRSFKLKLVMISTDDNNEEIKTDHFIDYQKELQQSGSVGLHSIAKGCDGNVGDAP